MSMRLHGSSATLILTCTLCMHAPQLQAQPQAQPPSVEAQELLIKMLNAKDGEAFEAVMPPGSDTCNSQISNAPATVAAVPVDAQPGQPLQQAAMTAEELAVLQAAGLEGDAAGIEAEALPGDLHDAPTRSRRAMSAPGAVAAMMGAEAGTGDRSPVSCSGSQSIRGEAPAQTACVGQHLSIAQCSTARHVLSRLQAPVAAAHVPQTARPMTW